jgi:hypothetical protein
MTAQNKQEAADSKELTEDCLKSTKSRPQAANGKRQTAAGRKGTKKRFSMLHKNLKKMACYAMFTYDNVTIDVMYGKSREKHVVRSAPKGPFPAKYELRNAN